MRPRIRTLLAVLLYCAATSCGGHAGVRLRTTAQADVVRALGSRIVDWLARRDWVRSFLLSREQVPTHLGRPDAVAMWKIQRLGPLLGPTEVDTLRSLAFRALGSRIVDLLARPDSVRSFLLSREQVPTHLGRPDAVAMWKIQDVGPLLGPREVDTLAHLAFSS